VRVATQLCLRPARCTHAAAHFQSIAYTPYAVTPAAPSAPCSINIHDRQAAARLERWRRDCSDLNSQPERPGDLDF